MSQTAIKKDINYLLTHLIDYYYKETEQDKLVLANMIEQLK